MRPIKFRAYLTYDYKPAILINISEICIKANGYIFVIAEDGESYGPDDGLKIVQYTGLKDKNGKEIYFGDILATFNKDSNFDIWNKKDNGYTVVQELENELGVSYSSWGITDDVDSIFNKQFVEIIGNIYSNPELLT